MQEAAAPFVRAIEQRGVVPDIQRDGLTWWQRGALRLAQEARTIARNLRNSWAQFVTGDYNHKGRDSPPGLDHDR
jgi:hypothetical protein